MDYTLGTDWRDGEFRRIQRRGPQVRGRKSREEKKRIRHCLRKIKCVQSICEGIIAIGCVYVAMLVETTDIQREPITSMMPEIIPGAAAVIAAAGLYAAARYLENRIKK